MTAPLHHLILPAEALAALGAMRRTFAFNPACSVELDRRYLACRKLVESGRGGVDFSAAIIELFEIIATLAQVPQDKGLLDAAALYAEAIRSTIDGWRTAGAATIS